MILFNKNINNQTKKEQQSLEFIYMYYAPGFREEPPVDYFFKNISTLFKYNNSEKCIKRGKEWYDPDSNSNLAFFEYDIKHNWITQLYPDMSIATLYLMNGGRFNSTKEKVEELKELLIQERTKPWNLSF